MDTEQRREDAIDEVLSDAWYVTLIGSLGGLFGGAMPLTRLAEALARRRNMRRLIAKCSECGGRVAPADAACRHCGTRLEGISARLAGE